MLHSLGSCWKHLMPWGNIVLWAVVQVLMQDKVVAIEAKPSRTQRPLQKKKSWQVLASFGNVEFSLEAAEPQMQPTAFENTSRARKPSVWAISNTLMLRLFCLYEHTRFHAYICHFWCLATHCHDFIGRQYHYVRTEHTTSDLCIIGS